jgi:transcriptional regulator with XRE-family HTH domain
MTDLDTWTGVEARRLRLARRMSVREFAAHLGVSDRLVSKWEAAGTDIRPREVNQAALDESLRRCTDEERGRFAAAADRPARVVAVQAYLLVQSVGADHSVALVAELPPVLNVAADVIRGSMQRRTAGG